MGLKKVCVYCPSLKAVRWPRQASRWSWQSLYLLLRWLCWQMLAPSQSLQVLLSRRLCSQMLSCATGRTRLICHDPLYNTLPCKPWFGESMNLHSKSKGTHNKGIRALSLTTRGRHSELRLATTVSRGDTVKQRQEAGQVHGARADAAVGLTRRTMFADVRRFALLHRWGCNAGCDMDISHYSVDDPYGSSNFETDTPLVMLCAVEPFALTCELPR